MHHTVSALSAFGKAALASSYRSALKASLSRAPAGPPPILLKTGQSVSFQRSSLSVSQNSAVHL